MERFAIKIDERVKLNLYNICRLCGIDNRDQVPIVEGPDTTFVIDDEPSLCKKIVDCVGIQVVITDRMPQKICILCVDKINDFYEYREMCKATNLQTRELLGLPPEVKDEKPPVELVPKPKRQQPFVEIPAENIKRKRKLKSECISYEELDDDEIDEKPPKKKFPKNSVGSKSKKHLSSGKILVKRESVKPLPSRVLPTREKAIPVSREKPATLIKEKLTTPPIKEKTLRDKSTTVKEKTLIVKEKQTTMKEKVVSYPVKEKGHLTKEKLPTKEKHPPPIKEKTPLVKEKTQIVKEKAQLEKVKLKPVKEKTMSLNTRLPILKEKLKTEKTTMKEKLVPHVEQKFEPASSNMDSELITLKTPNRRERQRELETKKKRKVQTLQPFDKVKTENLHPCIVCPKDFKTQAEYDIHFFREHTPNTLEHGCSACREAFYDLQEYRDHQLWHRLSSIPFSCFKCDSNFDRVTAYTRHFLTSCVPQNEYVLVDDIKCPKCQKIFITKNLYEWHGCLIKNNSKCPRCYKFFAKRLNLQRHVVVCNDKVVETQPVASVARNKKSEAVEAESFTAVTSNDGKKIVKIEPGSIIEIENESRVAVPNSKDGEDHEMEDSVENDVRFQDDHEEVEEERGVDADSEIDNSANLDKDNSDIILITDDDESTTIAPVKQEKIDRRYDEVICRASAANIPMVQIKQEIFSTDQVNLNILRNIKPEPIESTPEPVQGASKPNTSKNVSNAIVPECPIQATKLAAAKPTLKLKIKKEHGTLNSSFIESDLGEGDSSPNPNRSNDELGTSSHYHKRRNKHKKKIYKIPKQLALIIKQEKQTRDNYEKDTSIAEEDADSMITVPVISEVTSIADTAIETGNSLNQSEYFEEEEENPSMSICFPGQFREVTEDIGVPVESQNDIQMPVITEVVSLKQSEPCLPLISSVTSLSQTSGIRVKMEFSNFASPRPDSFETETLPDNNRLEQDDMITGNYHMECGTVENPDDHLENTDSEEIGLSTSKESIESDFEEKPNLEELIEMSDITKKIQNSTEVVLEEVCSPEGGTSHLTGVVIPSIKLTESISINKLSEISANILEQNEISEQENQPNNVNDLENFKNVSIDENISANLADQNCIGTNENVKNKTEEIRLVAEEVITTKYQDTVVTESSLEVGPANLKDRIDEEIEDNATIVTEVYLEPGLQPITDDIKLTKDIFGTELTIDVHKTDQTDVTHHESILILETDKPDVSISVAQENPIAESLITIDENIDCNESNLITSTLENNEKTIPVSRRISDLCDAVTIDESIEIPDNDEKINIQPETINKPDLEGGCNKMTLLNIQSEQATTSSSSSSNENKPTELVIIAQMNIHVEAKKRQLEMYENLEESSPKIQKMADIYLDNDIKLEDSKLEPLDLHVNQTVDVINQPTRVNAITKSEDILSEIENDEAKIKLYCNPVPNEEELKGDRQFDTTSPSEDDIHSNQIASNIFDLQNENLNRIEIIKAEVFENQTCDHDQDSVVFVSEHETSTILEDNFDLENQKEKTVEADNLVISSNLIENDTNEDQQLEITKGENIKLFSANLEEEEHMNMVDESTRDQAVTILEEGDSTIVSHNFNMQIDEDQGEINERGTLESIRSEKLNTSTTNKEASDTLKEELKIVSDNVELNEDLQRDATGFSQNVEEDNLIEIHQGSNFSVTDEELSIASDHQHCKLESSTNVVKEMSYKFQNENDINMENEDSNIIHTEVEQVPSQDEDLSRESNDGSSNSGLLEDNSNKICQKPEVDRDVEELTLDEIAVQEYPQYDEVSNRGCNPIISEARTVEVERSPSEMQLEYSINVEDEESTRSQISPVHSDPNMERVISTKNENETDNSVLQSDECMSPNIEQFNSNVNEVYVKYPSDVRIQPALENELHEISDESMIENISDPPLKEERIDLTESTELHWLNREKHLITDTLEDDSPLVDLNNPVEQVYEINSDSSCESTNKFENKLAETISESTKQAEEITTSEICSCDSLGLSSESSLDSSSDDSTSASSSNIEIETKDNLDFEQTLSSSKETSQKQAKETIKSMNTIKSLLVEKADVFVQINENAIDETSLHFQTNDNDSASEISSSSSDVILEENVETVPENIPSISSNVVEEASSHKNLNHNLDNITNLSINVLQTNQEDGIIYKTVEIEEDIDSDLEKELLEEEMHDEEPDE